MNIRKLLGLCEHEWEKLDEYGVLSPFGSQPVLHTVYLIQCSKCLKIKKQKV